MFSHCDGNISRDHYIDRAGTGSEMGALARGPQMYVANIFAARNVQVLSQVVITER